jgi:hypothetical protein
LYQDLHLRTERVLAFQILDKDEWIELNDLNFFIQRWSANDFKLGERDELVLKQGKVSEDTRAFISQKYDIPTDRLALVRFSNFQAKPLELVDAKWDPTLPIFPNKGDLVYWCDVSETPTALSKEERLKLQKTVCRRAEEKALTIQV